MERLIGIPYEDRGRSTKGADCWGLVRLAHRTLTGGDLPDYSATYASSDAPEGAAAAVRRHQADGLYAPVEPGEERQGDIIVLKVAGWPAHCGMVTRPGWMLHTLRGHDSALERYRTPKWERRVDAFWRPV